MKRAVQRGQTSKTRERQEEKSIDHFSFSRNGIAGDIARLWERIR